MASMIRLNSVKKRFFPKDEETTCQCEKPVGFTLVELLLVVAMTAVLAVILLPALSQARENGDKICMNNLKQLGLAIKMYAEDYDGVWLHRCSQDDNRLWSDSLYRQGYAENRNTFVCPSFHPYRWTGIAETYGVNVATIPGMGVSTTAALPPDNIGVYIYEILPDDTRRHYVNFYEAKFPSRNILLADTARYTENPPRQDWMLGERWENTRIHLRHTNTANILFLDGHVEACNFDRLKELGWRHAWGQDGESLP